MNEKTLTVDEAARSLAECVNRAQHDNMVFILVKNGVPVARLVPEPEKRCTAAELADALHDNPLPPDEASEWREDIRNSRETLLTPEDSWR